MSLTKVRNSRAKFYLNGYIAESDEIYEIRVRSIWIVHGFWAGLGSVFTSVTSNSITHWWVEIETKTVTGIVHNGSQHQNWVITYVLSVVTHWMVSLKGVNGKLAVQDKVKILLTSININVVIVEDT